MDRLFNLDPQLLHDAILLAINVFILFILLSYLLYNPVRKIIDERKERVKNDLEDAEKAKKEGDEYKAGYEAKLKDADKEAEIILEDARKRATKNEADIVAGAKEEAARIIKHANDEAELEKKRVADDVKKEVISVASAMAGKVMASDIDESKQEELLKETLDEIGEDTWLN